MKLQRWQDAWTSYSGQGQWVTVDRPPTTEELAIALSRMDGSFLSENDRPIVSMIASAHTTTLRVVP